MGHERRIYAAVKFFLFTMTGSVLMLAAIIYLYTRTQTFSYPAIVELIWSGRLTSLPASRCCSSWRSSRRFAHQSPHLPYTPGCPTRTWKPRGGLRDAGVRHAEDGHLRNPALLPAAVSQRRANLRAMDRVLAIIGIVYGPPWWPWCSQHEESWWRTLR